MNRRKRQIELIRHLICLFAGTAVAITVIFLCITHFTADNGDEASATASSTASSNNASNTNLTSEYSYATAAVEETPSPTPTAEPVPDTTITLCMVGDLLLSDSINSSCTDGAGNYDYNILFQNISWRLQNYDLRIINEETACGGTDYGITGYPSFNSPHAAQDAVVNAGFNCVLLATNHMLDYGPNPLFSTLDYWQANYPSMLTTGAYNSEEASNNICIYEKDGFKIAILNYTYGSNAGDGSYYDVPWALNTLSEDKVYADIQQAKTMADYIIVCPHWGTEYNTGIDDTQNYWASLFLDWGVDMVIGTHPHVIEPIEVRTDDSGHQMIVYYSLGNFVSSQDYGYSLVGGMADVTLRKTSTGVTVDDFGVIPLITHKGSYFSTYFMTDYSQDMVAASNANILDPDFTYDYAVNLANSIFGDRIRY